MFWGEIGGGGEKTNHEGIDPSKVKQARKGQSF